MKFTPLKHNDMGIHRNKHYRVVEALDGAVVFSYTKQGKSMVIHLACRSDGLKRLREAFDSFCTMLFNNYKEITMIIGGVKKNGSLSRMLKKCGCLHIANTVDETMNVFMKLRPGVRYG